jgi:nitrite reductase/ring-hydroxylating ferredoxin subunit
MINRRTFIRQTCVACVSAGVGTGFSGCQSVHYVSGNLDPKGLSVAPSEFIFPVKGKPATRPYIVVTHDKLDFPIYLYRISENQYNALWMKCTHQGSELQASGDHLYCASHGSEFDKYGKVSQGPAEKDLRTFPVNVVADKILIDLS